MWELLKRMLSKPADIDEATAIALFRKEPAKYFTYRGDPVAWPAANGDGRPIYPSDMRVIVGRRTVGYVERVQCIGTTGFIGHIAVAKELSGKGLRLGPVLARAYAAELRARYGVNRIVFAEDHTDYEKAGYPSFFNRLGAKPLPIVPGIHRADRPDHEWVEGDWGI